jgi:hypothetical protein
LSKDLDPRGTQTLEGERSQKKRGTLSKWKMNVYIVKDMMAIA